MKKYHVNTIFLSLTKSSSFLIKKGMMLYLHRPLDRPVMKHELDLHFIKCLFTLLGSALVYIIYCFWNCQATFHSMSEVF